MERKIGSGRKGTVDEEEYLLRSVTKLAGRWAIVKGKSHVLCCFASSHLHGVADSTHLLPHLFQFPTSAHRDEGVSLQDEIADFEKELRAAIDEIWTKIPMPQSPGEADVASIFQGAASMGGLEGMQEGWAKRMREYEMSARLDPLDKVAKPEIGIVEWKDKMVRV